MNDLEKSFELIDTTSRVVDSAGSKSEELVTWAENVLGLTFPPTYRRFVKRFGAAAVGSAEFYGVITDDLSNSSVPDAIWLTLGERDTAHIPDSLIVVEDNGLGGWYAIDTSVNSHDNENPVVEWWPNSSQAENGLAIVAEDFGEFLLKRLEGVL